VRVHASGQIKREQILPLNLGAANTRYEGGKATLSTLFPETHLDVLENKTGQHVKDQDSVPEQVRGRDRGAQSLYRACSLPHGPGFWSPQQPPAAGGALSDDPAQGGAQPCIQTSRKFDLNPFIWCIFGTLTCTLSKLK
jgi:hypothetical protein